MASHGLNPVRKNEFDDLLSDLDEEQRDRYRKALAERWPDLFRARDKAEWRQMLLDLVQQNIERLNAILQVHEANADAVAEQTFARLSFDPSPEGAALRNYEMKSLNALFRGMENYRKHKRRSKGRGKRAAGVGRHERDLDSSADFGGEAEDSYGSALGPDHSSASADGQGERLEPRIDYSEWVRRAAQSGCGTDPVTASIPQNETNEPNFDETVNITQEQGPIEVVANSDAQSGLDNGVVQPGEASEPEHEEVRKSASEIGNPESENAEWDDCPGGAAAAESSTSDQRDGLEDKPATAISERELLGETPRPPAVGPLTPPRARPEVSSFPTPESTADGPPEDKPTAAIRNQDDPPKAPRRESQAERREEDRHLARQQPALATTEGDGHLARQQPVPATTEGDGHLARQQPALATTEGDGHLARQQPALATTEGDGHLARQQPVPATTEGDGHLARQQPALATTEGDGHLARQQPAPATTEGDGHLARQHSVVPANANSPPGPSSPNHARKRDTDAFSNTSTGREPENPPSSIGLSPSGGLHGQVMRALRRRELEQNQKDGFRRPEPRARGARGLRNAHAFRKPQTLELPGQSPILASLPPADFSRVLAEVHLEFEEEIEKPENNTRSLT